MTSLKELADRALQCGEPEVFFQILGRLHVFHVCVSAYGNPDTFVAFNPSTKSFEWIGGNALIEEAVAPRGKGYRGFADLDPVPQTEEEVRRW